MKRLALLAGAVALGGGLFYAFHGTSKADTTPKPSDRDKPPVAIPTTIAPTAAPVLAPLTGSNAEHANVEGIPEALEPGYLAVERVAKTCFDGHTIAPPIRPNGPDETIESIQLKYRQVVRAGVGHIQDLHVANGKLSDQALQDCIVKVATTATWNVNAPDGLIGDLAQNINVGDLLRPDYGLPPESMRSPKPTAAPPPELAKPLGSGPNEGDDPNDDHPGTVVHDPGPARQPK